MCRRGVWQDKKGHLEIEKRGKNSMGGGVYGHWAQPMVKVLLWDGKRRCRN